MKFWMQTVSSPLRLPDFLREAQAQVNRAAGPDTIVEVHGTTSGALAPNYRFFEHHDSREIVDNIARLRKGGYDALLIACSVDAALTEAREVLDIPVFALTQTTVVYSAFMGERFGMIVSNAKFVPRYRELVIKYRQEQRMAAMLSLATSHIPDHNLVFKEPALQAEAIEEFRKVARQAIAMGADVLIPTGPTITLLAMNNVHEVDGVAVIDGYTLMVKLAEAAVKLRELGKPIISRGPLYASPPASLFAQARETYQIEF